MENMDIKLLSPGNPLEVSHLHRKNFSFWWKYQENLNSHCVPTSCVRIESEQRFDVNCLTLF